MAAEPVLLASRLNNYVMAQEKRRARNFETGELEPEEWTDVFTEPVPAEIITIGGEEGRTAMMQSGETRFRIRMRYRTDITASMRVRIDTDESIPEAQRQLVYLKSPPRDPDGRRIYIEINGLFKEGAV